MSDESVVTTTTTAPIIPKVDADTSETLVDRLVSRYGSANAALSVLADENFQYRTRHRDDQNKITEMQPLVVTKEEKNLLGEYRGYGTPSELKKLKEEYPQLQQQIKERDEKIVVSKAAQLAGFKETVLADQANSKKISLEIVKEEDGEEIAYAKFEGKDDTRMKLTEFAEKHLSDYILSLTAGNDARANGEEPSVTRVPRQVGNIPGQGSRQTNAAKAYLESTYRTPEQRDAEKSNAR